MPLLEPHQLVLGAQAGLLQGLNRRSDPETVIRLYESGRLASSEAATGEYVKALVRVDRLDSSALLRTLQVCCTLIRWRDSPECP